MTSVAQVQSSPTDGAPADAAGAPRRRSRRPGPGGLVVVAALVAVAILVPALFSVFWVRSFTTSAIYAIAAAGVGLLYGRLGLVSLGQIALVGVGGWISCGSGMGRRCRIRSCSSWPGSGRA